MRSGEDLCRTRYRKSQRFNSGTDGSYLTWAKCIPNDGELKRIILEEAHHSRLSIHPGMTKMYQDLGKSFWWPGMKNSVLAIPARRVGEQIADEFKHIIPQTDGQSDYPTIQTLRRFIEDVCPSHWAAWDEICLWWSHVQQSFSLALEWHVEALYGEGNADATFAGFKREERANWT
ncbi:uncharacterized protein LOC124836024 [Vigna umbellata]|uniref:uncharacterized protein LOC124836024 n=1 Tax=Vigna umbellata TaxID=87088 RepID=UPI001F5E4EB2|nr:uncharacterized protein LOC124836024 [Vigna umbellata]